MFTPGRSMLLEAEAAVLLLLLLVAPPPAAAAAATNKHTGKVVGGPGGRARVEDLPYIRCQVCELLAKNAWQQVAEMKQTATPADPLDEITIIERIEKLKTAWKPEGEWIAKLDLVESGDQLLVKEMDVVGNCGVECKTAERAAERIMGEHDTDVAEVLYAGRKGRSEFTSWLCHELTGVCNTPPPPLPKDRTPGPEFDPRQADDKNIDAMLGGLDSMGMGSTAKLRDQLLEQFGMKEEGEEDEDSMEAVMKRALQAAADEAEGKGGQGHAEL